MIMKHKTTLNHLENAMKKAAAALCFVAAILCMTTFASSQDKQTSNKSHKSRQTLTVSGKFLIDSTGKKVRQYLESAKAWVPMTVKDKNGVEFDPANPKSNKSCMPCKCHMECNRWDENGRCNLWIRTCDICCVEPEGNASSRQ
jgi:hypothetical protein